MRTITIVMAYYENLGMLHKQCEAFAALPPVIRQYCIWHVVDDGSPKAPAVKVDPGFPMRLWRMERDIRWNQDACRNIGVHHSETRWLMLTDMDHMIPEATLERLIFGTDIESKKAYKFARVSAPDMSPYKPHPNSWFLERKTWNRIGGYDERFAGYYGTDADFRERLSQVVKILDLDVHIIRVGREVQWDASTQPETYKRKTSEDQMKIKRIMAERLMQSNWVPKNLTFPYHEVLT